MRDLISYVERETVMVYWMELPLDKYIHLKLAQIKWYMQRHTCKTEVYTKLSSGSPYVLRLECTQDKYEFERTLNLNGSGGECIYLYPRKPRGIVKLSNEINFYFKRYLPEEIELQEDVQEVYDYLNWLQENKEEL